MKRAASAAAAAVAIVLTDCAADVDELRVAIDGVTVTAGQAASTEAQRTGLSGRDSVPEGTDMWFPDRASAAHRGARGGRCDAPALLNRSMSPRGVPGYRRRDFEAPAGTFAGIDPGALST